MDSQPPPTTSAPGLAATSESSQPRADFLKVRDFNFYYSKKQALYKINMDIPQRQVTAFIGPSGCGKSTLLRNFNRMNELIDGVHHEGDILLNGMSIYDKKIELIALRRSIGMVFQKSNPFPKSIYENIVYSLRIAGVTSKSILDETVERSLRGAALWDEVKDRLQD
ncbi:MAG: ATP-binding cassette domain-containing protein, partial [Terrimicrobiaceae bacterium]